MRAVLVLLIWFVTVRWFISQIMAAWNRIDFLWILCSVKWVWKMIMWMLWAIMTAIATTPTRSAHGNGLFTHWLFAVTIIPSSFLSCQYSSMLTRSCDHLNIDSDTYGVIKKWHIQKKWVAQKATAGNRSRLLCVHCFYSADWLGNLANRKKCAGFRIIFAFSSHLLHSHFFCQSVKPYRMPFNHFRVQHQRWQREKMVRNAGRMARYVKLSLITNFNIVRYCWCSTSRQSERLAGTARKFFCNLS